MGALLSVVALVATGCRGCMTENVVFEHTMNRPDPRFCGPCPPGKPCPPLIPEFEAPPGGPYLPVPPPPPVARPLTVAPSKGYSSVQQTTVREETFAPQRPAPGSLVPEVSDK